MLQPPPELVTLRKWSIASAILYSLGIPCVFGVVLFLHQREIVEDQRLLVRGTGGSAQSNPYFHIRQRFNQLYESFAPGFAYWRLVLILRKFLIVTVAVTLIASPMLQASLSVGIVFVSYALQVYYHPFIVAENDSRLCVVSTKRSGAVLSYAIPFNRLEAGYLMTSMLTLLSGMIFASGYVAVSSSGYLFLTTVVSALHAGSLFSASDVTLQPRCMPQCPVVGVAGGRGACRFCGPIPGPDCA